MIKRIRNWTDKSFENRQYFIALWNYAEIFYFYCIKFNSFIYMDRI